ncbi:hypothetical protein [Caulobacter hibisci]|uniref:Iron uptake protein n=1 Tax=Caulobacter hibisci TaxID=2035993 RepID=A0ABS0SWK4_9CAUL|nr:hypothetical protein [Caulobacter hibisci]MBI1683958.1 hypothetical protein [Caulobacter hibisci]
MLTVSSRGLRIVVWWAVCMAAAASPGWYLLAAPSALSVKAFATLAAITLALAALLLRPGFLAIVSGLFSAVVGAIALLWTAAYIVTHHFS